MRYEVYPSGAEWRWRLKARNGLVVSCGEGYKTRAGAYRGVEAHRRIAANAPVIEAEG